MSTPSITRAAFEQSLSLAKQSFAESDFSGRIRGWAALERAHVLGQPSVWLHVRSHAWMLWYGVREGDAREVLGQVVRLVLGIPGSALGKYPRGNTGRARVGMFEPMPIAPDVEALIGY